MNASSPAWRALGTAAIGGAAAVACVVVERRAPAFAFGLRAPAAVALELAAGLALVACALKGSTAFLAAAVAWFAVAWDSPAAGSPLLFTAALVAVAAAGPLAVHAALAHPAAGSHGRLAMVAVVAALGVAGVGAALFADPRAAGCADCPRNLLLVHGSAAAQDALRWAGVVAAAAALAAVAAAGVARLVGAAPAVRAARAPLLGPVVALAGVSAAALVAAAPDGIVGAGRAAQAVAILALAAGIAWCDVRRRRARAAVARLVVDVAPRPGGLAAALGRTLGDEDLRIAYPLADGRLVAADGRPADADSGPGQAVTTIVGDDRVLAQLVHRAGLLDAPDLADEIAAAARLGLQHERLGAEVRARLADLRASRRRVVAATDAERSRLERNLHDGAQQQLVALMLELRIARAATHDAGRAARLDSAAAEVSGALEDLHLLAGGLYPPALTDSGLSAALSALAEEAPIPVELRRLPQRRVPAPAEAAVYFVAAGLVREAGRDGVTIAADVDGNALWMEVLGRVTADPVELQDRVGALDGQLEITAAADGLTLYRVELPCAS
jgi:signal transduction histidine kinase